MTKTPTDQKSTHGDKAADTAKADLTEKAAPAKDCAVDAPDTVAKPTIAAMLAEVLMDVDLTYVDIVALVKKKFPEAQTTVRSVASVSAGLRKKGVDVPTRRPAAKAS